MVESYCISLDLPNKTTVGSITFYYDGNNVRISWLGVHETYQNQGLGRSLYVLMLLYLIKYKIHPNNIYLDDCSDWGMTKQSPYYKWGFRIIDGMSHPEEMKIVFAKNASYLNMKKAHVYSNGALPDLKIYNNIEELFADQKYELNLDNLSKYNIKINDRYTGNEYAFIDYKDVYERLVSGCTKKSGGSIKPTNERIVTKWGTRIVYVGKNKKEYIKHNKTIIPLSKLS